MARTKTQLMLRRIKRAKWNRGRLTVGKYRLDILPDGKWYLCIHGTPINGGSWRTVDTATAASIRALRKKVRHDFRK